MTRTYEDCDYDMLVVVMLVVVDGEGAGGGRLVALVVVVLMVARQPHPLIFPGMPYALVWQLMGC